MALAAEVEGVCGTQCSPQVQLPDLFQSLASGLCIERSCKRYQIVFFHLDRWTSWLIWLRMVLPVVSIRDFEAGTNWQADQGLFSDSSQPHFGDAHRHQPFPVVCSGSHYPDCSLWPLQLCCCQILLLLLELSVLLLALSGSLPPRLPRCHCVIATCQRPKCSSPVFTASLQWLPKNLSPWFSDSTQEMWSLVFSFCGEWRKPWASKFSAHVHCRHGHRHVEYSKASDLCEIGKAISPYGRSSREMAKRSSGVQVWVFMNDWSLCAKTGNCTFILLDLHGLKLLIYGDLLQTSSPCAVPNKHTGWNVADPSFTVWRCVCVFSIPSPPSQTSRTHTQRSQYSFLLVFWYKCLDKREHKEERAYLKQLVLSTVMSKEKMHACMPTAQLMFSTHIQSRTKGIVLPTVGWVFWHQLTQSW